MFEHAGKVLSAADALVDCLHRRNPTGLRAEAIGLFPGGDLKDATTLLADSISIDDGVYAPRCEGKPDELRMMLLPMRQGWQALQVVQVVVGAIPVLVVNIVPIRNWPVCLDPSPLIAIDGSLAVSLPVPREGTPIGSVLPFCRFADVVEPPPPLLLRAPHCGHHAIANVRVLPLLRGPLSIGASDAPLRPMILPRAALADRFLRHSGELPAQT
jgi:hypothetical protein